MCAQLFVPKLIRFFVQVKKVRFEVRRKGSVVCSAFRDFVENEEIKHFYCKDDVGEFIKVRFECRRRESVSEGVPD